MKFSGIVTSEPYKKSIFFKDKMQILSFATIVFSLISGSVFYLLSEDFFNNEVNKLFSESLSFMISGSAIEIFSGIIFLHISYLIIMVVFGTSSLGYIIVLLLTYFRTASISTINAFLYSTYGLKGIEYCFLIFFPGKFALLLALLMLTYFCVNNSLYVKKIMKGEYNTEKHEKVYTARILVIVLLFFLSALVECFLVRNFSRLFSF